MSKRKLQARRDPLQIRGQQLVAEVDRGALGRPRHAGLLVGSDQQTLAFLAGVDLGLEVDRVRQFLTARQHLGQVLGQEVVVLHGQDRQLETDQAADLACPQARGVDDLGLDCAVGRHHAPAAVRAGMQFDHRCEAMDLGAALRADLA